ncbi:MAG: twin-arginine translocation signal domain-containing protein, partial [Isosphaeraceae bacterium]|nr:twin-arginine translocation signal domain-containing protein [Isosphaeraceae bacterium]
MVMRTDRRDFLRTAAVGGALWGLGDLSFLAHLRPVSAQEARLEPRAVRLQPEIEPLVRLLEETPRERLLEEVAARIHRGTSYREVLAALLLAGVRNVQPRPSVGFKFHAVLVVNSAHLASLNSPDSDRWLPIFWALDYFKSSQAQDEREGNWTMGPVDESAVPPARKAREAFCRAMDAWDEPAADAAIAALARSAGANAIYELFFRYGARDFRSIGHKAIYVANSYRTLQCIGWQHAEPVLRSLAYALLMHEDGNPAERDAPADRPGRRNQERAARIKEGWQGGEPSESAAADLLATLRQGSADDACEQVVELLNRGIAPQSLWDALFDGAGELLVRQPGIVSLHAATSTNALHFAYQASSDDQTRRFLLLQNAAFLPLFREAMAGR